MNLHQSRVEERAQMVFDDDNDEEMTWHSLPTRVTRSQTKKTHNLSDAIDNNYSAARKHDKTMIRQIFSKLLTIFYLLNEKC